MWPLPKMHWISPYRDPLLPYRALPPHSWPYPSLYRLFVSKIADLVKLIHLRTLYPTGADIWSLLKKYLLSVSSRYASYWNAFLFSLELCWIFSQNKSLRSSGQKITIPFVSPHALDFFVTDKNNKKRRCVLKNMTLCTLHWLPWKHKCLPGNVKWFQTIRVRQLDYPLYQDGYSCMDPCRHTMYYSMSQGDYSMCIVLAWMKCVVK